ncbi:SGNH/GDSL hydrolase family protein, partial [Campylobacter coli]|nr:SGNH/GDSL hydrolase family protein [Campylobacter coli]
MKKIVLLGTSNSLRINGLSKGLKNQKIELINLSLGAGSSLHGICEIYRHRFKIKDSDLIIIEKNIIDTGNCISGITPINIILKNIRILYEEIYSFKKKVVTLILPLWKENILDGVIEQEHRRLCLKFGFNFIDIHTFFKDNNLINFYAVLGSHPLQLFMCSLGEKIVSNIEIFNCPKPNISVANYDFKFVHISDLLNINSKKHHFLQKNSVFEEFVYRVDQNYKDFSFPEYLNGYAIVGIYSWTKPQIAKQGYSTFVFIDKNNKKYVKDIPTAVKHFADINSEKLILSQIKYFFSTIKEELPSENTWGMNNKKDLIFTDYTDIIGFLLFKKEELKMKEDYIEQTVNFQKYNFSHLIPQCIFDYKQIIEEYLNGFSK